MTSWKQYSRFDIAATSPAAKTVRPNNHERSDESMRDNRIFAKQHGKIAKLD